MDLNVPTTTFNFGLALICFTQHSACGKKKNYIEIRTKMIKNLFFASVPKSPTQMRSLSVRLPLHPATRPSKTHSMAVRASLSATTDCPTDTGPDSKDVRTRSYLFS